MKQRFLSLLKLFVAGALIHAPLILPAQNSKIDSLKILLIGSKADSSKVNYLNALSWEYISVGSFDSALISGNKALKLAQLNNIKKGVADALNSMGVVYYDHGNYPKSLDYYFNSLKVVEELGDKRKEARLLSNIGVVYKDQGETDKSLTYYTRALKIDEAIGNKSGVAKDLGNIGLFYTEQNNYSKALECYHKVLVLAEELQSKRLLADTYSNIGIIFNGQGDSAITAGNTSFAIADRYPKALEYYFKGYNLSTELGDKYAIASCLGRIGWLYADMKIYDKAETYLLNAIKHTNEIGALYFEKEYHNRLISVYNETGDYKKALDQYKLYNAIKDTLFNTEKNKELTRYEMNYEFEKKEAEAKAEQEKKDGITLAEQKKQKIILLLVSCVLLIVFVFFGFIARSLRLTRKQKKLIELKNVETELQKKIIEEKNNGILDSIHYAKRIQQSLLPNEKFIERSLNRLNEK